MKRVIVIAFCMCIFTAMVPAQEPTSPKGVLILKPDKFDEWGNIPFNEEKAHLDKIASQAKEWSLSIIYLAVHAGQTACVGEAKARGVRAKDYLITRGVSNERIVWIDAGWRKDASVEVWIWPPQLGKPSVASDLDLKRSEVILQKNCRTKYRGHGPNFRNQSELNETKVKSHSRQLDIDDFVDCSFAAI